MGTTGIQQTMAEAKATILREFSFKNDKCESIVLKNRSGKGGLWIFRKIISNENGEYFTVDFIKMEHEKSWTYYKEMNFEIHPYFYDCPITWLDQLTPHSESGKEWIEKVRKVQSIVLKRDLKVLFDNVEFTLLYELTPTFWAVQRKDGKVFKMRKENIIHSIFEGK